MRLLRPRPHAPRHARRTHPAAASAPIATAPAFAPASGAAPPAPPPGPPAAPAAPADAGRAAERRLRGAGAPEDNASYACRCGAVFPAAPTTSVSCPLCGVHQAW